MTVHPGSYCHLGDTGATTKGTPMACTITKPGDRARWRKSGVYSGDVRYRVTLNSDGSGSVSARQDYTDYPTYGYLAPEFTGAREVGVLVWTSSGKIHDIDVQPDRQRRGIATAMWQQAQQATGGKLHHSQDRTDAGERFARSIGGTIPPRSDWRP